MYLFFVRRYNDIDHIVPIIYRMAKDGVKDIKIFCTNFQLDLKSDFRISFLFKEYNIKAEYYLLYKPIGFKHYLFITLARLLIYYKYNINFSSRMATKYLKQFYNESFINKYYDEKWALQLIDSLNPGTVIFDWQKPKPFLYSFINGTKKKDIPLLLVPHGMFIASNNYILKKEVVNDRVENYKENWKYFDFAISQHKRFADRVKAGGYDSDRIIILGSTRFCSEWREVLEKINPVSKYKKKLNNGINVVYMDHRQEYRFYEDEVIESINKLANLDSINLVVKPTTGRTHKSMAYDELGILKRENCPDITFEENITSDSLIEWADVVICTISSIGIEALLQNKILIHPQYFHENTLLYSEMNACWTVNNYQELEGAIQKIKLDSNYKPYSQADVDKFIEYVVYGHKKNRDVLGDYKDFILSKAQLN